MYKITINNFGHEVIIHSPFFNDLKLNGGQIKPAINIASGFTFTISPNNPGYNLIRPLQTLIKIENTKKRKVEFEGRVLRPTENMDQSGIFAKSFICESELGYFNDSCQRHGEYHNITVKDFLQVIIDNHNRDVADDPIDKTFELGVVEVDSSTGTLYRYLGYENTWETIQDKLLNRLGGELRVRKENGVRYLDYLWSIGEHKSTEIRLAKNMKSITKEVDPTELVTRLIPLGERIESDDPDATDASQARLTIESVNDGKDYLIDEETEQALGTIIYGTQIWDDVTQPNILKTRGQQWLTENNRMKIQYQVDALDLAILGKEPDNFEVGNWLPVINPVMNINEVLRIVGKTVDIINPEKNSLIIGDQFKKASEYQKDAVIAEKKVVELEEIAELQRKRIIAIRNEIINVEQNIENVQEIIRDVDLEQLPAAINALEQAITNLQDVLDNIPIYDLATHTQDGLMSAADKVKLDALQVHQEATETLAGLMSAEDKQKLDRITVTQDVDLDDLLARIEALENA